MEKERLLELAGMEITEGVDVNKKYPVVIDTFTPKKAFAELNGHAQDMIADGELPEDTKFTIDLMSDNVMNLFVDLVAKAYEAGSESARADNYIDAIEKTIKAALRGNKD